MEKLRFFSGNKKTIEDILKDKKRKIFNFLNLYSFYLFSKNKNFRKSISENEKNNFNFIDGTVISIYLMAKKIRGTDFTRWFLKNFEDSKKKKHFFVGFEREDIKIFREKFPEIKNKKLFAYNPPYIEEEKFSKEEIEKICNLIKKSEADCVWVGLGNPKQEILSQDIFKKTEVKHIFNVGAAFDFLIEKKKEAPKFFRKFGIEWLYRGIFDFEHSWEKVWKSFIGLFYLSKNIELVK